MTFRDVRSAVWGPVSLRPNFWDLAALLLLVGAMVFTSIALLCGIVGLVRGSRHVLYVVALVATWVIGFWNALHHARDAWAIMPMALVLSVIVTLLALLATWAGFASLRTGGAR